MRTQSPAFRPPAARALLALVTVAAPLPAQVPIDTLALRAHTYYLSHDLLAGRATGTPGADVAALYIAAQCRALGLASPAGGYFQPVPLEETRILPGTALTLERGGARYAFAWPDDVTPNVGTARALRDFAGPAVLVDGDAAAAGRLAADALRGRVAVTPGIPAPEVLDTLARRGAVGVVHLVGDSQAYRLLVRSRGAGRLHHADVEVVSSSLPDVPSLVAGPAVAARLLGGVPLDRVREGVALPLDAAVAFRLVAERRPVEAHNVACVLPGGDPVAQDTAIALTAHYDHLGVGLPDAAGDSIYNGFSDNAAGVAMLLAIAQALRADPAGPPRHSVLFLFFTGEERGLLGSDYYVARPVWPLARTAAVVNLDAGAPPHPPAVWRLAGAESRASRAAARVARARGWEVTMSPARANSDYYPFARLGVPAVFVIPGAGPFEGLSADSSNALRRRWDRYHRPDDAYAEDFPFAGLARYAAYAYLMVRALDGQHPQRR